MTVLILEVDWEAKRRAQRQIKCVVGLHRGNCIYILNKYVEHYYLVRESLALCNYNRNFAKLIVGADGFIVN